MSTQFSWPVPGGTRTSHNFRCKCPKHIGSDNGNGHPGVDIAAPEGRDIIAVADGIISAIENNIVGFQEKSYGNYIEIEHTTNGVKNGLKTRYCHCVYKSVLGEKGGKVVKNQRIAKVGNSGNSQDAHLHFEVHKNNTLVDPYLYVSPNS